MKRWFMIWWIGLGLLLASGPLGASENRGTILFVHGAWGGGWIFSRVDPLLTADGFKVYRPTLTGLGERVHLAQSSIGLDTHIEDIVNVILFENLHDIILVGHSYGGMVVTGVMDRVPDRIKAVVLYDALVPNDGESLAAALGGEPIKADHGFVVPPWVKPDSPLPHDVPHPVKTFTDPVSHKNPLAQRLPVAFILTVDPGKKPEEDRFYPFYVRAKERGWRTFVMNGADHNPQWHQPKEFVALLEKAISETVPTSP